MCGRMTAHIEGRLAFLKAELNITPEQEALWKDYANAVRDNAKTMSGRCTALMGDSDASEKISEPAISLRGLQSHWQ